METTAVSSTTASTASTTTSVVESNDDDITTDFDTFLLMLTTQLENQDPTDPVDSQDFAVDLATFSQVEQQAETNDLLQAILDNDALGGLSDYASWVGQDALSEAPAAYSGEPVDVVVSVPSSTDQATLVVRNDAGAVVSQIAIPAQSGTVSWDGTDSTGASVPHGNYSFSVDALNNGAVVEPATAATYGRVSEVRLDGGTTMVVFDNDATIDANNVTGIRSPEQSVP